MRNNFDSFTNSLSWRMINSQLLRISNPLDLNPYSVEKKSFATSVDPDPKASVSHKVQTGL